MMLRSPIVIGLFLLLFALLYRTDARPSPGALANPVSTRPSTKLSQGRFGSLFRSEQDLQIPKGAGRVAKVKKTSDKQYSRASASNDSDKVETSQSKTTKKTNRSGEDSAGLKVEEKRENASSMTEEKQNKRRERERKYEEKRRQTEKAKWSQMSDDQKRERKKKLSELNRKQYLKRKAKASQMSEEEQAKWETEEQKKREDRKKKLDGWTEEQKQKRRESNARAVKIYKKPQKEKLERKKLSGGQENELKVETPQVSLEHSPEQSRHALPDKIMSIAASSSERDS